MAKKKDPSVTFLNRFGYNVIKLPRAGIEPLELTQPSTDPCDVHEATIAGQGDTFALVEIAGELG